MVPMGFICGYPVGNGESYLPKIPNNAQGEAINSACRFWGAKAECSEIMIPYPLCRKPFTPFSSSSCTNTKQGTMKRNYGCSIHSDKRKILIDKSGIPHGWYDFLAIWNLNAKNELVVSDHMCKIFGRSRKKLKKASKHCAQNHTLKLDIVQESDEIRCKRCNHILDVGCLFFECEWCLEEICASCSARQCPKGHMVSFKDLRGSLKLICLLS
mmetsp:Transcript_7561/g.9105  ORF Transcript_7561/g.9105 Transcript_7561/m.9105 type:complete len:213 (+) Transcript_7561:404-1042(+)